MAIEHGADLAQPAAVGRLIGRLLEGDAEAPRTVVNRRCVVHGGLLSYLDRAEMLPRAAVRRCSAWRSARVVTGRRVGGRSRAAARAAAAEPEARRVGVDELLRIEVERGQLLRGDRQPPVARTHVDAGDEHGRLAQQIARLVVAVRPDRQLQLAAEVLEGDGGKRLALAGGQRAHVDDGAGDHGLLAGQLLAELGGLRGHHFAEGGGGAAERVLRHVRPQVLLLPREQLRRGHLHRFQLQRRQWRVHLVAEQVEHRGLPRVTEALLLLRQRQQALDATDHRAARSEDVERASLRQ